MAVYCGVCAVRLSSAMENYGSFSCNPDADVVHPGKIHDTCERCSKALKDAVTAKANSIASKHRRAVDALRAEIKGQRDREAAANKEEAEFRREWEVKRSRGGGA